VAGVVGREVKGGIFMGERGQQWWGLWWGWWWWGGFWD